MISLFTGIYTVLSILLPSILVILLVLIVYQALTKRGPGESSAVKKGRQAEKRVKKIVNRLGPDYISYHDIHLPSFETSTRKTQLDHLVLSKFGIFVIETKNYGGEIKGDSTKHYWQQKIGNRIHSFFSPVKQNQLHVNAVKNTLNLNQLDAPIFSVIVYSERASLRHVRVPEYNISVTYISKLKRMIKSMDREIWNHEEIKTFSQQIDASINKAQPQPTLDDLYEEAMRIKS
ncbi:nuclease-related domain-containing protein [Chryseomicrobium palamuruense]|uniref:Nuclease-related domain-containing protein n=1 Tax=Chryseomicrobium palamuruense TaxID=682973 RepID=A0ABV8UWD9_9BACL